MDREHAPRTQHREAAWFNATVHGARGAFSMMVYVFHVVNSGLATLPILSAGLPLFLLNSTEYGVELFFCISGFVISGTLRRARSPAAFLEDRFIRIVPVLWSAIFLILAVGLPTHLGKIEGFSGHELLWLVPANLLALPGLFHIHLLLPVAWSLSYELCFYLICAILWLVRLRRGNLAVWILAAVAFLLPAFYPRALYFLPGVLVAEGLLRHRAFNALCRAPELWLIAFLVLWARLRGMTPIAMIDDVTVFDWFGNERLPLALLAFACATMGFAGLVRGYGLAGWLCRTGVFQYLGTISYSFYIWHLIVMSGVKSALKHFGFAASAGEWAQAELFLAALPPSLIVATVSQRLIERRLGSYLRRRLHHPPSLQAAALGSVRLNEAFARETGQPVVVAASSPEA